jgi:hypothetical protein
MKGCATGEAVSHRVQTAEAPVQTQGTPSGINALEHALFGALRVPFASYHSTNGP